MCKSCVERYADGERDEAPGSDDMPEGAGYACDTCTPYLGFPPKELRKAGLQCDLSCGRPRHKAMPQSPAVSPPQQARAVIAPKMFEATEQLRSKVASDSRAMRRPDPRRPAAPAEGVNLDAIMRTDLAELSDMDVPLVVSSGRGAFGSSVTNAKPTALSKMKATFTATLRGAAALSTTDLDGAVGLANEGSVEEAARELQVAGAKRTTSGEEERAEARKKLKLLGESAQKAARRALTALQTDSGQTRKRTRDRAPTSTTLRLTRQAAAEDRAEEADAELVEAVAALQWSAGLAAMEAMAGSINSMPPLERRIFLSAFARETTKIAAEAWLGCSITWREWSQVRAHALYPGPGKPVVKLKYTRQRVKTALLEKLLSFLDRPDNLQRYAWGTEILKLTDGSFEELANVDRLKPLNALMTEFLQEIDAELRCEELLSLPAGTERCGCCAGSSGKGRQCIKAQGHEGQHKYTPKGSMSESTAWMLLSTLSGQDIRCLLGLDDVAVVKGRSNFIRMREQVEILAPLAVVSEDEKSGLLKRIEQTEDYLRIGFVRHLQPTSAEHACACLACGMHSDGGEHMVECSQREHHEAACEQCTALEQLISDLHQLQGAACRSGESGCSL